MSLLGVDRPAGAGGSRRRRRACPAGGPLGSRCGRPLRRPTTPPRTGTTTSNPPPCGSSSRPAGPPGLLAKQTFTYYSKTPSSLSKKLNSLLRLEIYFSGSENGPLPLGREYFHPKFEIVIFWLIYLVVFVWLSNLVVFKFSLKLSKLTYKDSAVRTFLLFLVLIFSSTNSLVSESKISHFFYSYYSASSFFTT